MHWKQCIHITRNDPFNNLCYNNMLFYATLYSLKVDYLKILNIWYFRRILNHMSYFML